MMELDEAIKHCEEVAEKNEIQAEKWQEEGGEEWGKTTACRDCAAEHRQLAEWLKELKELRKLAVINPIIAGYNEVYEKLRKGNIETSNDKDLLKTAVGTLENVMPKYRRLSEENQKQKEQIAEYKRLLKAAVKDFKLVIRDMLTCEHCKWFNAETTECSYPDENTSCKEIAGWRHEGEALKLIGEDDNESQN